ncbi:ATP-binding protein [Ruegeria arenilitoris]|uniref:ATP-binding protein n=1 Tax=Ruegeria arenilitoris TaxID=1173585 RepID=UPI00147DB73A|nr:ATP-binding protein [Ruegeria arenilitoris]
MNQSAQNFTPTADLEIGKVFEVAGNAIKLTLDRSISELNRSFSGRVYAVGQIGSILKIHVGRKVIFATVSLLRLQSDEEAAAMSASTDGSVSSPERRVIEANLLGEGWWDKQNGTLSFNRGVSAYPLPMQSVYFATNDEITCLYESVSKGAEGGGENLVEIGDYTGASKVSCKANVDKMFSQHCAILGSTGSGKSASVASILHSVLDHEIADGSICPNIVIIDPHGEYAAAFGEKAEVFKAYNPIAGGADDGVRLKLPYWLLSADEFRSLVIGKTEFEATSQANTVYKALSHSRMFEAKLVQSALPAIDGTFPTEVHPQEPRVLQEGTDEDLDERRSQIASFNRDRPRPFSLDEFTAHITNRQAKRLSGANWTDVTPGDFQRSFSSILDKLRVLTSDPRLEFLMNDEPDNRPSLTEVLSQFTSGNSAEEKPIKIVDISGLPNEIAGPLAAAIGRLLFQYKLHQSREEREADPVLLVCEEAHRYVPDRGEAQYSVAQEAIRRIAREGRKYGLGLMLVSQRPADVEGTVISQCNSWIVLRLSNSSDQQHVARFLPDSLSGMTALLPSLQRQEALFVGEAAAIPARIKIRTLSKDRLPNSHDISFSGGWASAGLNEAQMTEISQRMQSDGA